MKKETFFALGIFLIILFGNASALSKDAFRYSGWGSIEPNATFKDNSEISVEKINAGDYAFGVDGWKKISSIKYIRGEIQTYNLKTIENSHTFFADEILVHNKGGGGSAATAPKAALPKLAKTSAFYSFFTANAINQNFDLCPNDFNVSSGVKDASLFRCSNWSECRMKGSKLEAVKSGIFAEIYGRIKNFFINIYRAFFPDEDNLCYSEITSSEYDLCMNQCIEDNPDLTCYDSDGGINFLHAGEVSYISDTGPLGIYKDWCSGSSSQLRIAFGNILREGMCINGKLKVVDYACEVCSNGVCVPLKETSSLLIRNNFSYSEKHMSKTCDRPSQLPLLRCSPNSIRFSDESACINYCEDERAYVDYGPCRKDSLVSGYGTIAWIEDWNTCKWNYVYDIRPAYIADAESIKCVCPESSAVQLIPNPEAEKCRETCAGKNNESMIKQIYCKAGQYCQNNKCIPDKCNNQLKDSGEEGVDCGGLCSPCQTFNEINTEYKILLSDRDIASFNINLGEAVEITLKQPMIYDNLSVVLIEKIDDINKIDKADIVNLNGYETQGVLIKKDLNNAADLLFEDANMGKKQLIIDQPIILSSNSSVFERERECLLYDGCYMFNCSADYDACLEASKKLNLTMPRTNISCSEDACDFSEGFCSGRGYKCGDWPVCEGTINCGNCFFGKECYMGLCMCNENWACSNWSECSHASRNRSCFDISFCGTAFEKPAESEECEIIEPPLNATIPRGCTPNYICSNWSECEINPSFEDIISGVNKINGRKMRTCKDSNCTTEKREYSECTVKFNAIINKSILGKDEYIDVINKDTGEITARIDNKKGAEKPYVDISFITGKEIYPIHCLNGKLDSDETDIDCGGSCSECNINNEIFFTLDDSSFIERNLKLIIFLSIVLIVFAAWFVLKFTRKKI